MLSISASPPFTATCSLPIVIPWQRHRCLGDSSYILPPAFHCHLLFTYSYPVATTQMPRGYLVYFASQPFTTTCSLPLVIPWQRHRCVGYTSYIKHVKALFSSKEGIQDKTGSSPSIETAFCPKRPPWAVFYSLDEQATNKRRPSDEQATAKRRTSDGQATKT
jgi:hypothetical protein